MYFFRYQLNVCMMIASLGLLILVLPMINQRRVRQLSTDRSFMARSCTLCRFKLEDNSIVYGIVFAVYYSTTIHGTSFVTSAHTAILGIEKHT